MVSEVKTFSLLKDRIILNCIYYRFNLRFPFDWKRPFGYLFAFSMECVSTIYITSMGLCQTIFMIGSYWLFISLIKDVESDLLKVNGNEKDRFVLRTRLIVFIQLHMEAKQLSINVMAVERLY